MSEDNSYGMVSFTIDDCKAAVIGDVVVKVEKFTEGRNRWYVFAPKKTKVFRITKEKFVRRVDDIRSQNSLGASAVKI